MHPYQLQLKKNTQCLARLPSQINAGFYRNYYSTSRHNVTRSLCTRPGTIAFDPSLQYCLFVVFVAHSLGQGRGNGVKWTEWKRNTFWSCTVFTWFATAVCCLSKLQRALGWSGRQTASHRSEMRIFEFNDTPSRMFLHCIVPCVTLHCITCYNASYHVLHCIVSRYTASYHVLHCIVSRATLYGVCVVCVGGSGGDGGVVVLQCGLLPQKLNYGAVWPLHQSRSVCHQCTKPAVPRSPRSTRHHSSVWSSPGEEEEGLSGTKFTQKIRTFDGR